MSRTLRLTDGVDEAIRAHGRETYPHECCGALVGRDALVHVRSAAAEHDRRGAAAALPGPARRTIARPSGRRSDAGVDLLGFYHSHPDHPAVPSQYDLDHAWPSFSYVIVSVVAGEPGRSPVVARSGTTGRPSTKSRSPSRIRRRSTCNPRPLQTPEVLMPTKIHIPTPLRPFTGKQDIVEVDGAHRRRAARDS